MKEKGKEGIQKRWKNLRSQNKSRTYPQNVSYILSLNFKNSLLKQTKTVRTY